MLFDRTYNNGRLHIWYEGLNKRNNNYLNSEKEFKLLEKVFDNNSLDYDLIKIVTYIRTILKGYEESFLMVKLTEKNAVVKVRFVNRKFVEYVRTEFIEGFSKENKIIFRHSAFESNTLFINKDGIENNKICSKIQQIVSKGLEFVSKLQTEIVARELTPDDSFIIYLYEAFFREKFSITDDKVEARLQSLLYVLQEFDIPIQWQGKFANFYVYNKYPESCFVSNWLRDLILLEEQGNNTFSEVPYFTQFVVSEFGQIIRNNLPKENFEESFSRFCTAIFFKKYLCRNSSKEYDVSSRISEEGIGKYPVKELKTYFNILKMLNEKYIAAKKDIT
ncbi:MAG: hypothetical protein IKV94_00165 [Clostridia bacterium]|nr:hypothetical protein [Clostridia bacterium]